LDARMTIGFLQIDFLIPGARSLKEKRRVISSLKKRLHNRYNCSVAETDFKNHWGRARLAICVVSGESRHANAQLNEIVNFASADGGAQVIDYQIEML